MNQPPYREKVNCSCGAPMGRVEGFWTPDCYYRAPTPPEDFPQTRLYLREVPINSQGYDPGGAYLLGLRRATMVRLAQGPRRNHVHKSLQP